MPTDRSVRRDRLSVLTTLLSDGLLPSFHDESPDTAEAIARSLHVGGARVVEWLHRSDVALSIFRELRRALRDTDIVLGVGSIADAPTAAIYLAEGAEFVVGPSLSADVARLCNRRKVAYLPGCFTPTEVSAAEELGCEVVKLFPSSAIDGKEFLRSLLGPMPWSRVLPTGNGVPFDQAQITDWIKAGACAVGMGSTLIDPMLVAARDFKTLRERTRKVLDWIAAARG